MRRRHLAVPVLALMSLALAAVAGCTTKSTGVVSVWPVATHEATVAPPPGVFALPLTGIQAEEDSLATTVPVCVKVRNDGARSPSGVGQADVVYETADGGSGTRLACLFQSRVPARIGPVDSAGMPDLWIVPQYHAMLFSTGATSNLAASMRQWPQPSDASFGRGSPFDSAYRGGSKNKYVLGREAAEFAAKFGSQVTSRTPARLRFSASNEASANVIEQVSVPFSSDSIVEWRWDEKSGTYVRSVGGKAARDGLTRKRISATNVVVLWVRYASLDPDAAHASASDVTLGGSGRMSVFRNGVRFDGKWKARGQSPPRLFASDGSPIGLEPGTTWFEAVRLSTNITLK